MNIVFVELFIKYIYRFMIIPQWIDGCVTVIAIHDNILIYYVVVYNYILHIYIYIYKVIVAFFGAINPRIFCLCFMTRHGLA